VGAAVADLCCRVVIRRLAAIKRLAEIVHAEQKQRNRYEG
jgi:hypothetical protein